MLHNAGRQGIYYIEVKQSIACGRYNIMIKPEYGKVCGSETTTYEVKLSAESAIATQEDVKKPISLSATAFIVGTENKDATTIAKIKVAFCFIYLAEDGFKKSDFSTELTAEIPFAGARVKACAEDARAVSAQEGYVAKCAVKVCAEGTRKTENNVLIGGDNLKIKERTEEFDSPSGITTDTFVITDEFDVGYGIKEVLCYGATACLKSVTSGVSCVVFEGEVNLLLKTLPFSDNNDILKERRVVPFRFELENAGSLPDMRAKGECEPTRVLFKVFTDEAKGKSTVNAEITLAFSGESIETTAMTVADDVYSVSSDIEISKCEVPVALFAGQSSASESFGGAASGEIPEGGKVVTSFGERITVLGTVKTTDGVTVNGIVRADVVFRNADNGTSSVNAEMPFSVDVTGEGEIVGLKLDLTDFDATIKDGAIYFNCSTKAVYKSIIVKKITVIDGVNEVGIRKADECAISVFVPKKGDELWDISKQLRVSEEEIMKCNENLEFPLRGDERIIIYRQKF